MREKRVSKFSDFIERIKRDEEGLFSDTVMEIHPTGIMYITGCKKITKYDMSQVELCLSGSTVLICGERLGIENLVNGQIAVTGKIKAVNISDAR